MLQTTIGSRQPTTTVPPTLAAPGDGGVLTALGRNLTSDGKT